MTNAKRGMVAISMLAALAGAMLTAEPAMAVRGVAESATAQHQGPDGRDDRAPGARSVSAQAALVSITYLPTGWCLWSLYDHSVSTDPCNNGLRWNETHIGGGWYQFQNVVTGECLSNYDYVRVFTATCNISEPGQWWSGGNGSPLRNFNTGKYLYSDYTHRVTLTDHIPGANWSVTYV